MKILSNKVVLLGGISGTAGLLNLLSIYLVTQEFGITAYGKFAIFLAIVTLVSTLMKLGLDTHIMKVCPQPVTDLGPHATSHYLSSNLSFFALGGLGTIIFSVPLGLMVLQLDTTNLLGVVAATAFGMWLKVFWGTFLRCMGYEVVCQFYLRLSDVLLFTVLLVVPSFTFDQYSLFYLWLAAVWINCLSVGLIYVVLVKPFRKYAAAITAISFAPNLRELAYYWLITGLSIVLLTVDVLLIGRLSNAENVGIYSIIKRCINQIYLVVGIFQSRYWTDLSVAIANKTLQDVQTILHRTRRAVIFSLPVLLGGVAVTCFVLLNRADVILTPVIITTFAMMSLAMTISALFLFAATIANLGGLEKFLFLAMFSGALIFVFIILLSQGNPVFAAAGFLIYQLWINIALYVKIRASLGINLFAKAPSP